MQFKFSFLALGLLTLVACSSESTRSSSANNGGASGQSATVTADADTGAAVWTSGSKLVPYTGPSSVIAGTLDGAAVDVSLGILGYGRGGTGWSVHATDTNLEMKILLPGNFDTLQTVPITSGLLWMQSPLPHAGEYLCIDQGQALRGSDGTIALAFEKLSTLGSCGEEASVGSLSLSYQSSGSGTITGTLAETSLNGTSGSWSCGAGYCTYGLTIAGEFAALYLWFNTKIGGGVAVPVTQGVLFFWGAGTSTITTPARLSCVGAGATVSQTSSGPITVAVPNLSAVRTCPGTSISGSLGVGITPIF